MMLRHFAEIGCVSKVLHTAQEVAGPSTPSLDGTVRQLASATKRDTVRVPLPGADS